MKHRGNQEKIKGKSKGNPGELQGIYRGHIKKHSSKSPYLDDFPRAMCADFDIANNGRTDRKTDRQEI